MLASRSATRRPPSPKQILRQCRYLAIFDDQFLHHLIKLIINMHLVTLSYTVLIHVLENRRYETKHRMRFEGLMAVNIKLTISYDVMT
jgi:hypothetical protein